MTEESLLGDLLSCWQHQQSLGRDLPADVLCHDHPDLVAALQKRIDAMRRMGRVVGAVEDTADEPTAADGPPTSDLLGPTPAPPVIPGYELLGLLGRGGMGVVYKARQINANRVVALKTILAGRHAGATERARFHTEAEAIARLQHPNIVQIYEVGEHDGYPFFSLEYCAGGNLEKKLNGTPLPPREAARLVETLAGAVAWAHDHGVIHRDLKPANILLQRDSTEGNRENKDKNLKEISNLSSASSSSSSLCPLFPPVQSFLPKISDFGLAKRLDQAGNTATGAVLGTPSYMAPEQARGEVAQVGPLADVYALGALLYECLTGRPPFRAATGADTLMQVLHDDPVPPSRLQRGVPRDLETICLKCLQKEPHRRYPSAALLAADLGHFLADEPIVARPVSVFERAGRWCRRKPVVAGLLALLVFVVAGSFAGLTALYLRADREWRRAEAEARRADDSDQAAEHRAAVEGELRETFGMLIDALRAADPLGVHELAFYTPSDIGLQRLLRPFLDRAAQKMQEGLGSDPATRAELLDLLGNLNRNLGRFAEAEPLLEAAVAQRRDFLGEDHPDYAVSLHHLAWLHHDRGRYADAERLYRLALDIRLRARGDDDPIADRIRFNLAWLLTQIGDYAQAEQQFQGVLTRRITRHGPTSREAAIVKGALAALYLDSGDTSKAWRYSAEMAGVISKADSEHGLGQVVAAFQAGVLATYGTKDGNAAERHLQTAADLLARQLGDSHVYMALVLHELASARESKGDLEGAEAAYRRCLDITRQAVGLGHPKAAVAVASFGSLLYRRGKSSEANDLFEQLQRELRLRFGADHPLIADALVEWSEVLTDHNLEDGEARVLGDALAIYRKASGSRHRLLVRCLNNLAMNHYRRRDYARAEELLTEALPLARVQYGSGHPRCASVLDNLASTRLRRGKTEGVEELLREALAIADVRVLIGSKPAVLDEVLGTLGRFHRQTGRWTEAEATARKRRDEARGNRTRLYESACDLALLAAAAPDAEQRSRCGDEAVAVLRQAVARGYKNLRLLQTDRDLDALRTRDDFRRLLDSVLPPREKLPPPQTQS